MPMSVRKRTLRGVRQPSASWRSWRYAGRGIDGEPIGPALDANRNASGRERHREQRAGGQHRSDERGAQSAKLFCLRKVHGAVGLVMSSQDIAQ